MTTTTEIWLGGGIVLAVMAIIVVFAIGLWLELPHAPDYLPPAKFHISEKVCYVDDSTLIGRVMSRDSFGIYHVQWVSPSSRTSLFGGRVSHSAFSYTGHKEWELKSRKETEK